MCSQWPTAGEVGMLALNVVLLLHTIWSFPALAVWGKFDVIVVKAVLLHPFCVTVQLNWLVLNGNKFVTVVLYCMLLPMLPEPLTNCHEPLPGVGSDAWNVALLEQTFWLDPALALTALFFMLTLELELQVVLLNVHVNVLEMPPPVKPLMLLFHAVLSAITAVDVELHKPLSPAVGVLACN